MATTTRASNSARSACFERRRLALGEFQDGALAADFGVVMRHVSGAPRSDQARQRLARDARERKVDNIRIAEQIVEERLDGFERIRPAQLKQHHPEFQIVSQFCECTTRGGGRALYIKKTSLVELRPHFWRTCASIRRPDPAGSDADHRRGGRPGGGRVHPAHRESRVRSCIRREARRGAGW